MARILQRALVLSLLLAGCRQRSESSSPSPQPPPPPAAVTDLAVTAATIDSVTIEWTAPGNSGTSGTAAEFDIRYATSAIATDSAFDAATAVAGAPAPLPAGTVQSMVVGGLADSTTYWFAIKTTGDTASWSALSNSPSGTTGSLPPPDAITDLAVTATTLDSVTIRWTAPGNSGTSGTAAEFDIRYATRAITTNSRFNAATQVAGAPAPLPAGTVQSMVVGGLAGGTTYWFAIKTAGDTASWSALSNSPSGTTLSPPPPPPPPSSGTTTVTFTESSAVILNPERGFYPWIDLISGGDLSSVRSQGFTIGYCGVHLDSYAGSAIPASFLTSLGNGFARARAAGIKVLLRFQYNDGFTSDAPKSIILQHIEQLKPVLQANADVITAMQAGFIGAWGEWHSSTNGLDNTTDRRDILLAVLAALPPSRLVQVRTPHFVDQIFGNSGPIADADAFSGSNRSRVGHHNDAFLNGPSDDGTYMDPVAYWEDYVAQDGRYTPIGGETNSYNPPETDGPNAVAEMTRLHWSFINIGYEPNVVQSWRNQGYFDTISAHLGYRVSLKDVTWTTAVAPGGELYLAVNLANTGYASMYNRRRVYAVIDTGTQRLAAPLAAVDPRRWQGKSTASFQTKLRIPATLAPGTYRLCLWLPDDSPSIADRPEYAVRLANDGVWDASTGCNVMTAQLRIDASAGGSVDPNATVFEEIP